MAEKIEAYGAASVRMETFGARPESSLETCRKLASGADALVVLVAHRYGWVPTEQQGGDGKTSITWHEVQAALAASPEPVPVFAYLIDESHPWSRLREETRLKQDGVDVQEVVTAVQQLEAFKAELSRQARDTFTTADDLGGKVATALGNWLIEKVSDHRLEQSRGAGAEAPQSPHGADPRLEAEIARYREHLEEQHDFVELVGFPKRLRVPIKLEELYVTLHAMPDMRGEGQGPIPGGEEAMRRAAERDCSEIVLTEAFAEAKKRGRKGVVVLGDPGSGKTTHLRRMALWMLRRKPESLGLPSGMLPVFLPLRRLDPEVTDLDSFIEQQLADDQLKTRPGFGQRLLQRGNLLFLLDGLDEVVDAKRRRQVTGWIERAMGTGSCKFIVTCRFAGYTDDARLDGRFLELHLRPLVPAQAADFVRRWYRIVETGVAEPNEIAQGQARERAKQKAEQLVERLAQPDLRARRVSMLTSNPLLLTNLCLVHRDRGGVLPQRRSKLYEDCVDVLLESWRAARGIDAPIDAAGGKRVLQPVARWLHGQEERTRASAKQLAPVLEPALRAVKWGGGDAKRFLSRIRDESGLLTGWDQQHFGFMHLGFQEFLAAREIRRLHFEEQPVLQELAKCWGKSWWLEVCLLLVSLPEPSVFIPFLRHVVQQEAFGQASEELGFLIEDAAETSEVPFLELLEQPPGEDEELWQRQLQALRALDQMQSPAALPLFKRLSRHPSEAVRNWVAQRCRPAQPATLSSRGSIELVPIPAGAFVMGSPGDEPGRTLREGPQRRVTVAAFEIGRYPVTNEEYGRFLQANQGRARSEVLERPSLQSVASAGRRGFVERSEAVRSMGRVLSTQRSAMGVRGPGRDPGALPRGGIRPRISIGWLGIETRRTASFGRSVRKLRMPGASSTCWVTYGSGSRTTSTQTIRTHPRSA